MDVYEWVKSKWKRRGDTLQIWALKLTPGLEYGVKSHWWNHSDFPGHCLILPGHHLILCRWLISELLLLLTFHHSLFSGLRVSSYCHRRLYPHKRQFVCNRSSWPQHNHLLWWIQQQQRVYRWISQLLIDVIGSSSMTFYLLPGSLQRMLAYHQPIPQKGKPNIQKGPGSWYTTTHRLFANLSNHTILLSYDNVSKLPLWAKYT